MSAAERGAGKYDDLATLVRERSGARGVLLFVIGGHRGSGFSVQTTDPELDARVPSILRSLADSIEEVHRKERT